VRAWVRIDETVPLRITYLAGAIQRQYEPDFIVIDDAGVHWIVEGKRDSEMTSPVVVAKRDAAAAWVKTVNGSDEVHETWAYLLASESVCSGCRVVGSAQVRRPGVPVRPPEHNCSNAPYA
jgi:type III restriction enzyme